MLTVLWALVNHTQALAVWAPGLLDTMAKDDFKGSEQVCSSPAR
jgi:hypothetical protein